jgi:tetratricopeptide (TPR) repeat protein
MPLNSHPRLYLFFIVLAIAVPQLLFSSQPAPFLLQQGVEWGITHNYDRALELFNRISRDYPEQPEGPFYLAAIYQSMMLDFESAEWQEPFYQGIEEALRRARQRLYHHPEDPVARFYAGAACMYKSAQLGRDGKYWPAYRAVQSSLDYLEPLIRQDSSFCDALLGIGTYQYWRSRITVHFSWLPFFPDRRREGITNITRAAECAQISPASAWSNLTWIYIREKEYDRAMHYARLGLARYPASRFFLWPLAEAQFLKADFKGALGSYSALLASTQAAPHNNGYNALVILWKLAQCHDHLGEITLAEACYKQVEACPVAGEVARRAEDKKRKAREWLKKHAVQPAAAD